MYAQFIDPEYSNVMVLDDQKRVTYDNGACSNLKYTLYSNCENCEAVLVLTSDGRKISHLMNVTDNQRLNNSWSILQSQPDYHAIALYYTHTILTVSEYDDIINSVIDNFFTLTPENAEDIINEFGVHFTNFRNKLRFPQQIYTYPLYVTIQFQPCPLGFILSQSQCDCNKLLQYMPTVECNIDDQTITRAGSV